VISLFTSSLGPFPPSISNKVGPEINDRRFPLGPFLKGLVLAHADTSNHLQSGRDWLIGMMPTNERRTS